MYSFCLLQWWKRNVWLTYHRDPNGFISEWPTIAGFDKLWCRGIKTNDGHSIWIQLAEIIPNPQTKTLMEFLFLQVRNSGHFLLHFHRVENICLAKWDLEMSLLTFVMFPSSGNQATLAPWSYSFVPHLYCTLCFDWWITTTWRWRP